MKIQLSIKLSNDQYEISYQIQPIDALHKALVLRTLL